MHRGGKARLPEDTARVDIEGSEHSVQVAGEGHASGRRDHARQEWRALFVFPNLAHGPHVVCRQLADVAVSTRHLKEPPQSAVAATATRYLFDRLPIHIQATLTQGNDQPVSRRVVGHRRPILAAFGRRARRDPFSDALLNDVVAIMRFPGLRVDRIVHILEHHFLVAEVFSRLAVQLPQNTGLTRAEH